jgi:hypothetical protein
MVDKIIAEAFKTMAAGLTSARAANLANSYILFEVVQDLAGMSEDRDRWLSALFERVSARADLTPVEQESQPFIISFRSELEKFFGAVAKSEIAG